MTPDTEHDTAQAVIEAARALMKHFRTAIGTDFLGRTYLEVSVHVDGTWRTQRFYESAEPLPDTFFGRAVELSGALDAHDEATIGEGE